MKHNQYTFLLVLIAVITSCSKDVSYEDCEKEGWHKISLSEFSLVTPDHVRYVPQKGIDSFVGDFVGDALDLSFDYSVFQFTYPYAKRIRTIRAMA